MELENLKTALENRAASVGPGKSLLASGAASVSMLAKIERSLKWEIALAFAFAAFCLMSIFLIDALSEKIFLFTLLSYTAMFLVQLAAILRKSKKATDSTGPVKDCLEASISVVTRFMQFYERLTTWFLPLVFIAAMLAALISEFSRSGSSRQIPFFSILVSLPLIAGWIWLMRKFSRWWLNRLYGNYLRLLITQLDELRDV
jgi:Ca2+/Na+ antiporter